MLQPTTPKLFFSLLLLYQLVAQSAVSNYAEQERLLKEQEQLKYQTLLSQLKAKGIDITALE
jgi:hypothetical protein